jgi:hypothetical protein
MKLLILIVSSEKGIGFASLSFPHKDGGPCEVNLVKHRTDDQNDFMQLPAVQISPK